MLIVIKFLVLCHTECSCNSSQVLLVAFCVSDDISSNNAFKWSGQVKWWDESTQAVEAGEVAASAAKAEGLPPAQQAARAGKAKTRVNIWTTESAERSRTTHLHCPVNVTVYHFCGVGKFGWITYDILRWCFLNFKTLKASSKGLQENLAVGMGL